MLKNPLTAHILLVSLFPVLLLVSYLILATRKLRSLSKAWYILLIVIVLSVYGIPISLNFSWMKDGIRTSLYGDYYTYILQASQIILNAKSSMDVDYCPGSTFNYPLNTPVLIAVTALVNCDDIFTSIKIVALTTIFFSMLSIFLFSKIFCPKNRFAFSFLLAIFLFFGDNLFWLRLIPAYARIFVEKGLGTGLASPYWALHFKYDPGGHFGATRLLFAYDKTFCIPFILLGTYTYLQGLLKEDYRRILISGILGTFIFGSHPYAFIAYFLGIWASLLYPLKHLTKRNIVISSKFALISTLVSISTIVYWGQFIAETMFIFGIFGRPTISVQSLLTHLTKILFQSLESWGVYFFLLVIGMLRMKKRREYYWLLGWLGALFLFYVFDPMYIGDKLLFFSSFPLYFISSVVLIEMSETAHKKVGHKHYSGKPSLPSPLAPHSRVVWLTLLVLFSTMLNSLFLLPMHTATTFVAFHPWTEIRAAYWLNRYSLETAIALEPNYPSSEIIIPIFASRRVLVGPWWHARLSYTEQWSLRDELYAGAPPQSYYNDLKRFNVDYIFLQSYQQEALDQAFSFPKFDLIYNDPRVVYLNI